jgi:acyl dehydratase
MDQLNVGDTARFTKTVTEIDIAFFAAIGGDFNPVHFDDEHAKATPFGARVAHGPVLLAFAANVLGMQLPGVGTIAVENQISYRKPVYIGDTITTTGEVAELDAESHRAKIALTWTGKDDAVVATGMAIVMPPKRPAL